MAHFVFSVIILFSLYNLIHCDPTSTIKAFIESNGLTSTIKSSVTDDNLKTLRWPVKYTYVDPVNDKSFEVVVVFWYELVPTTRAKTWTGVIPPKVLLTNGPSSGPNIAELRNHGSATVKKRNAKDVSYIIITKMGDSPWFADLAWLSGSDEVAITPWGYGTGGVKVALRLATDFAQKCGVDVAKIHDAAMFPCISKKDVLGKPKSILDDEVMQFARVLRVFQGKTDCSIYESGGFKYDWSYLPSDEKTPIKADYDDFMTEMKAMTVSTALASITGTGRVNVNRKQEIKSALEGTSKSKLGQALVKLYTPGTTVGAGCVKYHDIMDKLIRAVLGVAQASGDFGRPSSAVQTCDATMMAKESKNIAELILCWSSITKTLTLKGIQSISTTKSDRKTFYTTTVPDAFGYSAMRIGYNQYNGYYSKRSPSHSQNRIKQKRSHSQNIYNYDYPVNNDYQSYNDYNSMQSVMVVIVTLIFLIIMLVICYLCGVGCGCVLGMVQKQINQKNMYP